MPSSVLNLELSSGAFSTGAFEGVPALEGSLELRAEAVVELGWAFSAGRSAMAAVGLVRLLWGGEEVEICLR